MYKKLSSVLLLSTVFLYAACDKNEAPVSQAPVEEVAAAELLDLDHSPENALDWNGVYQGVVPCASCEGIETQLTLNLDNSFVYKTKYLGGNAEEAFEESGKFNWINGGSTIVFNTKKDGKTYFTVGENYLELRDQQGNPIKSELNYQLEKQPEEE